MGIELAKAFITIAADQSRLIPQLRQIQGLTVGAFQKGLGLAADLETATLQFETMLGSASDAKTLLGDLSDFAAKTPFEITGLRDATGTLLGFGVQSQDVMGTLKVLGDISATTGVRLNELAFIFGKVRVLGKLTGETYNQLAERRIPDLNKTLAEVAGVAEKDLLKAISKSEISFEHLQEALRRITSEGGGAADGMEKLSTTFTGRASTMRDAIDQVHRSLGEALLPAMNRLLEITIPLVEAVGRWVKDNETAAVALIGLTLGVTSLTKAAALLQVAILGLGVSMQAALIGTGIGVAVVALGVALGYLWDRLQDLKKLAGGWGNAWKVILLDLQIRFSELLDLLLNFGRESERTRELARRQGEIVNQAMQSQPAAQGAEDLGKKIGEQITAQIEPAIKPGFVGFAELGRKIQEQMFAKSDDLQAQMVGLQEVGNRALQEIAQNTRPTGTVALGLS